MMAYIRKVTERRESGASAVEYGLLVALIAAVIVLVVLALGGILQEAFTDTCTAISGASNISSTCTTP